jgi:hypothetical protein
MVSDDDGAVSARNALSFLRTNSTLKSLKVSFAPTQRDYVYFRLSIRSCENDERNPFLESLTIKAKFL